MEYTFTRNFRYIEWCGNWHDARWYDISNTPDACIHHCRSKTEGILVRVANRRLLDCRFNRDVPVNAGLSDIHNDIHGYPDRKRYVWNPGPGWLTLPTRIQAWFSNRRRGIPAVERILLLTVSAIGESAYGLRCLVEIFLANWGRILGAASSEFELFYQPRFVHLNLCCVSQWLR